MEVRRDKILGHKSIIVEARSKRPQYYDDNKQSQGLSCVFCPGEEHLTTQEYLSKGSKYYWHQRLILNKYPFISGSLGDHFVIIETPIHSKEFWDFSQDELLQIILFWQDSCRFLKSEFKPVYIFLFKNRGKEAGASIAHSHSQLLVMQFKPDKLIFETKKAYENGICHYCELLNNELDSQRNIKTTDNFVTLTVYAPRFNYETIVMSRHHNLSFIALNETELRELSSHLYFLLKGLKKLDCAYNIYFHNVFSSDDYLHFHLKVIPRINIHGAYELGTDEYIISVSPEEATRFFLSCEGG